MALTDGLGQRPGVTDAGGAAVAHQIEAQSIQFALQAGRLQVVGHHLAARRQGGLDPGLGGKAARAGLFRQQAGRDQDAGVAGVGAGGDGRDHHRARCQLLVAAGDGRRRAAAVLGRGHGGLGRLGHSRERHPVLRALGPGQAGLDGSQIQLQGVGKDGIRRGLIAPHALGLGIGLHQGDALRVAAGKVQVAQGLLIDREDAAGGAVFRRHVGDGGLICQAQLVEPGAEELDELADHALGAQHLHHRQDQIGGRRSFAQGTGEAHAHHLRDHHGDRLAEHGGLGLDAAHAPAEDGQAVDHGGVAVGAH